MKYQIMLNILFSLLAKKTVSARELANRNEVSERSIYRYIDEMTIAGIPIDIRRGRGGGVYISDSFRLPSNFFSKEEYNATLSALQAMRGQLDDKAIESAIEKLSCNVREEKRDPSVHGDIIVDSSTWGDHQFTEKIHLLQGAIRRNEIVDIDYVSRTGEHTKRHIEPYVLIYKQNIWYVYAYCLKRESFRLFKIGRIRTMRLTEKYFEKQEIDVADIPLNFRQEKVKTTTVRLEISPEILPDAEEWLGLDCIHPAEGKFCADIDLPEDDGLIRKILSLGRGVKVLYPQSVKEAVKGSAKEIASYYE
jgi:predicted DNA-binding transcriptional regulator YafY